MGVPKFPKLGLSRLWRPITLCIDLRWRWVLKKRCSLYQELSNSMWHTTYTQGNWGDSWLLMVGSHIVNLTPNPSFGHNLCSKCPNGWCEPIQIFTFQDLFNDIRNILIQWVLTPTIALWRFRSPLGLQFPKWEVIWECGSSFPHSLLHSREHEMWFSGSFLARTFVSFCLALEPKARVATFLLVLMFFFF
jgi:hypothetical protein